MDKSKLPPQIANAVAKVEAALKPVLEGAKPLLDSAAPLMRDLGRLTAPAAAGVMRAVRTAMASGRIGTVGSTFRHVCVVGLNRSELLLVGETNPVFADNWQDLADDTLRRHLGLIFFAPRGLDGQPVNPYLFLIGDQPPDSLAALPADTNLMAAAQQMLGGMGLLDFCRMPPAAPNTINLMLAADVLFHWDVKDNYVLPTTSTGWVRDVEQVLKGYPRTTKANLYTNWDTAPLPPTDRVTVRRLTDLPLEDATWLNKPTTQEKYGNHVLAVALFAASATWGLLHLQQRGIDDLNEQLRVVEQQIPREGKFAELGRAVTEQEKMMRMRELFYLAVKDSARAIAGAQMKFDNFEVKVPDPQDPPDQYIVTIEAEKNAYNGWLEEEPIAKNVLMGSAMMVAVRKPPATTFKIEGLIPLAGAWKDYRKLSRALGPSKPVSSTAKPSDAPSAAAPLVSGKPDNAEGPSQ